MVVCHRETGGRAQERIRERMIHADDRWVLFEKTGVGCSVLHNGVVKHFA